MKAQKLKKRRINPKNYLYHIPLGHVFVEYFIFGLVIVSLTMLVVDFFIVPSAEQLVWIDRINLSIGLILLGEFILRLVLSNHKHVYLRNSWWYLLATIPLPFAGAEILRSLRLIGFIRLMRIGAHAAYEKQQTR